MTIHDDARSILRRTVDMCRLANSVQAHLLADQLEAVSPGTSHGHAGSDISDPTYRATRALAPFAMWERDLSAALRSIDRAMNDAETTFQRVLAQSGRRAQGQYIDAEERCAGWSDERRARLGGCGNVLETYRDRSGANIVRPERLCVGCRKAKNDAERGAA